MTNYSKVAWRENQRRKPSKINAMLMIMMIVSSLADPAELHLIGSWQEVLDGLAAYAEAGVSDLRIEVAAHTEAAREATRMALADYLSS